MTANPHSDPCSPTDCQQHIGNWDADCKACDAVRTFIAQRDGEWKLGVNAFVDSHRAVVSQYPPPRRHEVNPKSDPCSREEVPALDAARETIRRLNRRVQVAEGALAEKLDEAKKSGGSLGRSLTAWAYTTTSERLHEIAAALHGMKWDDLPAGLHRFRRDDAKYATAEDFTDIRVTRQLPERLTPDKANAENSHV